MTIVGNYERDKLGIAPGRLGPFEIGLSEFPFGRPAGPEVFAKGDGIGLEGGAAAFRVEIPLIPIGSDLLMRFGLTLEHDIRRRQGYQTSQSLRCADGYGIGGAGAPIVADENET